MTMSCENCKIRARCDENPKSLIGRLWRFHARFCPGWKRYLERLPEEERAAPRKKYDL